MHGHSRYESLLKTVSREEHQTLVYNRVLAETVSYLWRIISIQIHGINPQIDSIGKNPLPLHITDSNSHKELWKWQGVWYSGSCVSSQVLKDRGRKISIGFTSPCAMQWVLGGLIFSWDYILDFYSHIYWPSNRDYPMCNIVIFS